MTPGNSGLGEKDAFWLLDFQYNNQCDWTRESRNNPNFVDFYNRIEILLNWAVYYIACALAYTLRGFSGECTQFGGELYYPDPWDRLDQDAFDWLARYAMIALSVVGVIGLSIVAFSKKI